MPEHSVAFSPEDTGATLIAGDKRLYHGISRDSRTATNGDVFYCMSSAPAHIHDALSRGATAIVMTENALLLELPADVAVYRADGDIREHLARAAALCFPSPGLQHICAVTGTNGKTSVAHIYRSLLAAVGTPALSVGTLGMIPESAHDAQPLDFGLTTPDPITLHRALHDYSAVHGVSALCIEASSHGLDQRRCDGLCFNAAVFTNFTEDHIDYHKTKEAYLAAKRRIFALTRSGGLAVINADMPECELLTQDAAARGLRPLTVGYNDTADWRISSREDRHGGGQTFTLTIDSHDYPITLSLSGGFQAYNACFALAAASDAFPDRQDALRNALGRIAEVPGRMQRIVPEEGGTHLPAVYVDFAHTPDALINAARALKGRIPGRLVIVFGCGGDRDRDKRPLMGKAAAAYGDRVIVTDDNPRTENAAAIRTDVMQGCPDAENISPREQALAAAILNARPDDTILLAGKGHEDYQVIGTEKIPYSDSDTAQVLLAKC